MIKEDIGYILHKAAMLAKCNFSSKLNIEGITPGQFAVLKVVYYHQKEKNRLGLSPACIATQLEIDRPTTSGIVERLEAQGWINRLDNPEDKRSYRIVLTEKAVEKFKEFEVIHCENTKTIVNGFTEEEINSFRNFLVRVKTNFDKKQEVMKSK